MKQLLTVVMALLGLFVSGAAAAHDGKICYSDDIRGFSAHPSKMLNNATKFDCGNGLKMTVSDLFKAGWSIKHVSTIAVDTNGTETTMIIIEKD